MCLSNTQASAMLLLLLRVPDFSLIEAPRYAGRFFMWDNVSYFKYYICTY